ncbi:tyrosine-type recombinase/integrase [Hufsiella ginkgonis]|uniref:Tyrosine-type recombinase/integrase n=1 Tax=Hufsiella ginkgonis TaxID=2695274 RepID=A0A7K1XTT7_9SPHI|nr:tyrosine-type recombinase/integrase [Hufsiella ginkgonis]MXV14169.1 tyrosine-type recombinase/integrase [Hufsiella ginkgonis]
MLNTTGNRMSGQGYQRVLSALLFRAGLPQGITLHHLRHSIATHLLASGVSMEMLREFLGHSRLETTQIYAGITRQQVLTL